jgi:hypothetical protein
LALVLHLNPLATQLPANLPALLKKCPQFENCKPKKREFFMKELNIPEQSTTESPCETGAVAAMTAQPEALNLLEVMEICSELCVTHPARLLQILEECAVSPEITVAPLVAEIMSLKGSRFGRRLEQIH